VSARLDAAVAELVAALRDEMRTETGPDRLLSIDETSAALSIGRSKLYSLLASGELRSLRIGDRRLVSETAVREFIERSDGAAAREVGPRTARREVADDANPPAA
jgi:excisionase family DNA binding protein